MRVRKQRANVDSFTRAGVVGKAHSDCFAAQLSVPWAYKTAYPEGARTWGVGKEPLSKSKAVSGNLPLFLGFWLQRVQGVSLWLN